MKQPKCNKCGRFGHTSDNCTTEPRAMKGTDCGGIRDLKGIKDRCRIDDETGCWTWAGASATGIPGRGFVIPVAWSPVHGRLVTVTRMAVEFSRKLTLGKRMTWRTCSDPLCVNPQHLKFGTRKEWGEWTKKTGALKGRHTPGKNRAARIKRGDVTTTMELAEWARESTQTGRAVAHALGCSEQQVSRMRRMQTWRPSVVGASVFSWASGFIPMASPRKAGNDAMKEAA